jgi:hypothetical protein
MVCIQKYASNNPSIVACVLVAAVTYLENRYLATVRDAHTQFDGRGSGAMTHIPSFIQIDTGIYKLIRGRYSDTQMHMHYGDRVSLLYFFFKVRKLSYLSLSIFT